jgi:sulfur carrier protein
MIELTVNGEYRSFPRGATVAVLVDEVGCGRRGVAVAVNEEVVSRSAWEVTELVAGDRVEILRAAQGG